MAAPPSGAGTARPRFATGWRHGDGVALGILAAVTYLPLLLTRHGRLDADTKQYLYLDPSRLLQRAPIM